ncbi:MAG: hypothetical protein NXH97_18230 [Rhodobacteraceae bacterium]|nr:hypothetical protein [Paracoccaceae bacterium]
MSELQRLENAFRKADERAQAGDAQAAEDARMFAAELRRVANHPQQPQGPSVMGQVNAGIAETVGGLVDFVNPFDNQAWEGTPLEMGSAEEALKGGMRAINASVADEAPEGMLEGFGRGTGNATGALLPIMKGLQGLSRMQGVTPAVRAAADDALKAFATRTGIAADALAGGISGAAEELAEEAGAPEWVQQTAEMAAPMAVPATAAAIRGTGNAARGLPGVRAAERVGRDVVRGVAPMTDTGAREVAGARLRNITGGEDRARELAGMIDPDDAFKRSPAQQTGDPRLLGLEATAAGTNPLVRESLDAQRVASSDAMRQGLTDLGGDVTDARKFFSQRLKQHKTDLKAAVENQMASAGRSREALAPGRSESAISESAVGRVRKALDTELMKERELWASIPREASVGTNNTRSAITNATESTPWAQRRDLPGDFAAIADGTSPIGEQTTVRELHGLYSEMRRVARTAMAGTNQNRNQARIANEIAEAALKDLGAVDANTPLGQQINEARAFSRALHETFDTGAVGRMLQRTIDGDEQMAPAAALARTVGRGGAAGMDDARRVRDAAPAAARDVSDYLQGRFSDALFDASGKFTPQKARTWMRNNAETLRGQPELRKRLLQALGAQEKASTFKAKTEARAQLADQSGLEWFNSGQTENAITAIFGADDPVRAATAIRNAAAKDPSGDALAGVKAGAVDYLIRGAQTGGNIDGTKLLAKTSDGRTKAALRRIFSPEELKRVNQIADAFVKMNTQPATDGAVIDSPANQLMEWAVRIVAARQGGAMGGGSMGGSLQTANIATTRAQKFLENMTNDKARQLLIDAVEDPKLMRELLLRRPPDKPLSQRTRNMLAPYIAGGASQTVSGDE